MAGVALWPRSRIGVRHAAHVSSCARGLVAFLTGGQAINGGFKRPPWHASSTKRTPSTRPETLSDEVQTALCSAV
ncbi:hypothetical protein PR003_g2448 [Phytophthora rubi]|uniref:Uncharacterized protein n=1 Tax=Phytophthora rubi TaxID=129364 RepID=A0A6A3P9M0_9STRA|nr:hypothetical protein PR001_g2465 [Phytophthora rubi]KAE9356200.1 hypothetical protein PR003_g2448 [Phytophthora rubi]